MNEVLYHLCLHSVDIMDGWLPFPSTVLSKICEMSLYKTRKELKKLKDQGFVKSIRECMSDDEGNWIINGYTITEKAKETEEFKKAWEREREICKQCFGIDRGECDDT